jgi:hypothetical protein
MDECEWEQRSKLVAEKEYIERTLMLFYVVFFGSNFLPPVSLHRLSVTATEREE